MLLGTCWALQFRVSSFFMVGVPRVCIWEFAACKLHGLQSPFCRLVRQEDGVAKSLLALPASHLGC